VLDDGNNQVKRFHEVGSATETPHNVAALNDRSVLYETLRNLVYGIQSWRGLMLSSFHQWLTNAGVLCRCSR